MAASLSLALNRSSASPLGGAVARSLAWKVSRDNEPQAARLSVTQSRARRRMGRML
jgi:hypothetical protein